MTGTVASFAWNHRGLGHASRLTAVHSALRERGWRTVFLVEHEHRLLTDYGFDQIIMPDYSRSLVGDEWWGSQGEQRRRIAELVIREALDGVDAVLHDVMVHRGVHQHASAQGIPQAYIHRLRKDRSDPAAWVASEVPGIRTVYLLDHHGHVENSHGVSVRGVSSVVRRLLADAPVWETGHHGIRVVVSAAGGGHPDAEGFLDNALAGIAQFAGKRSLEVAVLVVTGPYFRGRVTIPASDAVRVQLTPYVDAHHSVYRGTDVLIAQGGYNTVQEIVHHCVPAVTVPGERALDDQRRRLSQLASRDGILIADGSAEDIARCLLALTNAAGRPVRNKDGQSGAEEIADDITNRLCRSQG